MRQKNFLHESEVHKGGLFSEQPKKLHSYHYD